MKVEWKELSEEEQQQHELVERNILAASEQSYCTEEHLHQVNAAIWRRGMGPDEEAGLWFEHAKRRDGSEAYGRESSIKVLGQKPLNTP